MLQPYGIKCSVPWSFRLNSGSQPPSNGRWTKVQRPLEIFPTAVKPIPLWEEITKKDIANINYLRSKNNRCTNSFFSTIFRTIFALFENNEEI